MRFYFIFQSAESMSASRVIANTLDFGLLFMSMLASRSWIRSLSPLISLSVDTTTAAPFLLNTRQYILHKQVVTATMMTASVAMEAQRAICSQADHPDDALSHLYLALPSRARRSPATGFGSSDSVDDFLLSLAAEDVAGFLFLFAALSLFARTYSLLACSYILVSALMNFVSSLCLTKTVGQKSSIGMLTLVFSSGNWALMIVANRPMYL